MNLQAYILLFLFLIEEEVDKKNPNKLSKLLSLLCQMFHQQMEHLSVFLRESVN